MTANGLIKLENILKKGDIFGLPSGIIGNDYRVDNLLYNRIPELGLKISKGTTVEPREGWPGTIITQISRYSLANAVGLRNPGINKTLEIIANNLRIPKNKVYMLQLAGSNEEEFAEMSKRIRNSDAYSKIDCIEVNVFCPNTSDHDAFTKEMHRLGSIVHKIKEITGKAIFVKLAPRIQDIARFAVHMIEAGAYGISGINTDGPNEFKVDDNYVLYNKTGGFSGDAVFEKGLNAFKEINKAFKARFSDREIPYIVYGGIRSADQIREYGKTYEEIHGKKGKLIFAPGTSLHSSTTETIIRYFAQLKKDLREGTNEAEKLLDSKERFYRPFILSENRTIDEGLHLLEFNDPIESQPGQYVFAWLPEFGGIEKPFTILDNNPLTLLVKTRGEFTKRLNSIDDKGPVALRKVYIKGSYGKEMDLFDPTRNIFAVGGGCGVAALYPVLDINNENRKYAFLGFANKKQAEMNVIFGNLLNTEVFVSTDDKSFGFKGNVVELLEKTIEKLHPDRNDVALNCGPDAMVYNAIKVELRYFDRSNIISAPEFMTRCGEGICAIGCATNAGYRSCVDGPFLALDKLLVEKEIKCEHW